MLSINSENSSAISISIENFSGRIDKDTEAYNLLFKYIRHIELVSKSDSISFSAIFDEINIHPYLSSLYSVLCV